MVRDDIPVDSGVEWEMNEISLTLTVTDDRHRIEDGPAVGSELPQKLVDLRMR